MQAVTMTQAVAVPVRILIINIVVMTKLGIKGLVGRKIEIEIDRIYVWHS
jgi:hypothetical protein